MGRPPFRKPIRETRVLKIRADLLGVIDEFGGRDFCSPTPAVQARQQAGPLLAAAGCAGCVQSFILSNSPTLRVPSPLLRCLGNRLGTTPRYLQNPLLALLCMGVST